MSIERILRFPEVRRLTGYSRPSIYRLMKAKNFPSQVVLSNGGAVGWLEADILAWIRSRRPPPG